MGGASAKEQHLGGGMASFGGGAFQGVDIMGQMGEGSPKGPLPIPREGW